MINKIGDKRASEFGFHLAGIIPLCGRQYRERNLPWHPALLPLNEDTLLVDQAVVQCAWAGCETIWLVVDDALEQYFRNRLGDYIEDPVYYGKSAYTGLKTNRKIPIYYVPENPDDRNKRDSVSNSVIRGAYIAKKITGQISVMTTPNRFFVTFPYGVYSSAQLRSLRAKISSETDIVFECAGESIRTGVYMPFTITHRDAKKCREHVRLTGTGTKDLTQPKSEWHYGAFPTKVLPVAEQYSGKHFGPDEVFRKLYEKDGITAVELEWFFDVSNFDGYRQFVSSDKEINTMDRKLFISKTFNSMSFDDAEFEEEE